MGQPESRLSTDVVAERAAVVATLEELGPDAPTLVDGWNTSDLALHLVSGELLGTFTAAGVARVLIDRGVRLDAGGPAVAGLVSALSKRRSFEWALARLRRRGPLLFRTAPIARVVLLELWVHHEDVLLANDGPTCGSAVDLQPVVEVLLRYQRRELERQGVLVRTPEKVLRKPDRTVIEVEGPLDRVALWLSGRRDTSELDLLGDSAAVDVLRSTKFAV